MEQETKTIITTAWRLLKRFLLDSPQRHSYNAGTHEETPQEQIQPQAEAGPRVSQAHANPRRTAHAESSSTKRPLAADPRVAEPSDFRAPATPEAKRGLSRRLPTGTVGEGCRVVRRDPAGRAVANARRPPDAPGDEGRRKPQQTETAVAGDSPGQRPALPFRTRYHRRDPPRTFACRHRTASNGTHHTMQARRRSPLTKALLVLIHLYRNTLSLLLIDSCRFNPTCSEYALTAIDRHGAVRGLWLTSGRVLRCRPFAIHGIDQVPE